MSLFFVSAILLVLITRGQQVDLCVNQLSGMLIAILESQNIQQLPMYVLPHKHWTNLDVVTSETWTTAATLKMSRWSTLFYRIWYFYALIQILTIQCQFYAPYKHHTIYLLRPQALAICVNADFHAITLFVIGLFVWFIYFFQCMHIVCGDWWSQIKLISMEYDGSITGLQTDHGYCFVYKY